MDYAKWRSYALLQMAINAVVFVLLTIYFGNFDYANSVLFTCFALFAGYCHYGDLKENHQANEAAIAEFEEQKREEEQLQIEQRRTDKDSLGYRMLSQFINLDDGSAKKKSGKSKKRELQPVLRIDMNKLSETQALLIDSYLADAESIESVAKVDGEYFSDSTRNSSEKIIREAAIHLSNALLQSDLYSQQSDLAINQYAAEHGIIIGGACDLPGRSVHP